MQFYPNFNIGGMNPDHDFFQVSKLSEDQKMEHFFPEFRWRPKKRSSPKMERFFSPNSGKDLRTDAHQSQIIGGDISPPPPPPGFGTPAY